MEDTHVMTGTRMRAAVAHRFGGPEVVHVEEVPKPTPKADEVLIRVHASTVSIADHRTRSRDLPDGMWFYIPLALGVFRPRKQVLGMDVAGVVEAVGHDVTGFAPGDEVIAMLGSAFGGHAEYACVPQSKAIALKPRNLSMEESVTLVFGGYTALSYLNQVDLEPGDEVLVNGASGAVGTAVVQLAKLRGARVTAVCSGGNAEFVRSLGADRVIDYTVEDFAAERPDVRRDRRMRRQRAVRARRTLDQARRRPAPGHHQLQGHAAGVARQQAQRQARDLRGCTRHGR